MKDQSLPDSLKIFLEGSTTLDKFETEIVAPDDIKTTLKGQSDYLSNYQKSWLKAFNTCFWKLFFIWFRKYY